MKKINTFWNWFQDNNQTIKNLKDPAHPYRKRINAHFGNRVEVFDKVTLLQGNGFNATSIKEQLNIMVFSFDSLRANNTQNRKVFQEHGNLQTFEIDKASRRERVCI